MKTMSVITHVALQFSDVLKKVLFRGLLFFLFFALTLGFEILSNMIVFVILPIFLSKLKFHKGILFIIMLLCFLLVVFFAVTQNNLYFKYWIITLRMFILVSCFNYLFWQKLKKIEFRPILEKIFYIHIFCIIACSFSPSINNSVSNIFAYSVRETNFRVSGFFSGFDIVSFFILVYLSYEYLGSRKKLSIYFLIKLFLGGFAIFQSGRFGIIPLAAFIFILFFKYKNIKWVIVAFPLVMATLASGVLDRRIDNILSTFNMVQVAVKDLRQVDNSFFEGKEIVSQYNQSPLTWYFEFIKPFKEITNYLIPGRLFIVDSGPSFFILNFGLFIAAIFYAVYFNIFKLVTRRHIPFLVMAIILLADLKFRLLFSLMPLVWVTLNHFSFIQQLEQSELELI